MAREPAEDLVDRPILVVEQQPPGGARHDGRDDGGQHEKRHEDLPPRHLLEEQVRHGQPEDQLQRQRDRRDDQRMQQRLPEAEVLEQLLVIIEPGEGGIGVHHVDAHEGYDERIDQRKQAHGQQQEDRRRNDPVLEIAVRVVGGDGGHVVQESVTVSLRPLRSNGRRWREATDEGLFRRWASLKEALIPPSGTFSHRQADGRRDSSVPYIFG